MGFPGLFMIAVGLSMDAFAVSVCKGLAMKRVNWGHALVIALFFGAFQALMPLLGFFLGTGFASLVEPFDHWIAFVLLALIGAKMIWDSFHEDEGEEEAAAGDRLDIRELFLLAIATSIDAFAVGCTFAFMAVNIAEAVTIIGVTTFALSLAGVALGNRFGTRYNRAATLAGGIVLILIGAKTLLEHLGLLPF